MIFNSSWLWRRARSVVSHGSAGASLSSRLALGFGLILVMMGGVGGFSWTRIGHLSEQLSAVVDVDHQRARLVGLMQRAVDDMAMSIYLMALSDDPEVIAEAQTSLGAAQGLYGRAQAAMEKSLRLADVDHRLSEQFKVVSKQQKIGQILHAQLLNMRMAGVRREGVADFAMAQLQRPQTLWIGELATMRDLVTDSMDRAAAETKAKVSGDRRMILAVLVLAMLLGTFSAASISRSITRPLRQAVAHLRRVASGDLALVMQVDRRDEIGALQASLGEMQASLRALVGAICECADNIRVASTEVADGNGDLSERTESAARSLQATALSMQTLKVAVGQNAESATLAKQLVDSASVTARRGGDVMRQLGASMTSIHTSSSRIADITTIINSLAEQTKLLALNAAVEAARAGEAGRGFAVVATEVRGLAQHAAHSAREIKELIDESVAGVSFGARLVREAGNTVDEVVLDVRRVSEVIGEIAAASASQRSEIGQINVAVVQLDEMTRKNALLVEQGAAASESLKDRSLELRSLVGTFQLGGPTETARHD